MRQRRIEAVVTIVALALALPHLLEPETTQALLGLIGIDVPHAPNGSLTDDGHLIVLGAQLVIIGIIMAVVLGVGYVVMRVLGKQRGPGKRRRHRPLLPFDPS